MKINLKISSEKFPFIIGYIIEKNNEKIERDFKSLRPYFPLFFDDKKLFLKHLNYPFFTKQDFLSLLKLIFDEEKIEINLNKNCFVNCLIWECLYFNELSLIDKIKSESFIDKIIE